VGAFFFMLLSAISRSIRRKVMLVVLVTTFAALGVTGAALLVYEARAFRAAEVDDLSTQADILARSSAPALAFEDPTAAQANLSLLRSHSGILAAAIYRQNGTVIARYRAPGAQEELPALPSWRGYRLERGRLVFVRTILENGESLGAVYLRARYEIVERMRAFAIIVGAVMVAALFIALLLSGWLQGAVTTPILALTEVSRKVVSTRDFSLRVQKSTQDEVGVLVDAFNAMLTECGDRTTALEEINRSLQRETEERRAAEVALLEADRRKDEFLATLAHELRNPLAPMRNALAILRSGKAGATAEERSRAIIERQLAQMVRLVDDLLDVARITTGKLTIQTEPIELAPVIRGAIDAVQSMMDAKRHELRCVIPAEPIFLDADATRLAQVFANLLGNAAKYTEPGGHISISAHVDAGDVLVRVADDGMGISPEMMPRLFQMFTQADIAVNRPHQSGLGVGLSLARRIVELHGGRIQAESAGLGQGCTFTVRLPVTAAAVSDNSAAETAKPVAPAPRRILLVDDNVDFTESLALLLKGAGHQVQTAHEARSALRIAAQFAPEVAFLDIGMPGVSGYELARQLRSVPATMQTALIAISGWGQVHDRLRAHEAGFSHHLVKPVELEQILVLLSADASSATSAR
jgi:signal transduction histidine kinase/ActR/RegA family two-component response regulator